MGGMAAQIPVRNNPEINEAAFAKVREDKAREAADGHDGTWVAHPGLVPVAMEQFDKIMPEKNQIENTRTDISITAKDLLKLPEGTITEKGLRANISIGIQYMASWLSGNGCVPLNNLMEDAATAEISRTQVWQWIHNPEAVLDDGRSVTLEMVRAMISDEVDKIIAEKDNKHITPEHYQTAERLFETIVTSQSLEDFLTIKAYEHLD